MLLMLISVIICLLAAIGIAYRRRSRRPAKRLAAYNAKLIQLAKRKDTDQDKIAILLKDIYAVLNFCLDKNDSAEAYRTVDLLKLVFAEGFWRIDEPLRLTGIVVAALKAQKPDIASVVLDAFRPLLLHTSSEIVPQLCEQFSLISAIALRQKQHFLVVKISEHIFYVLDKQEWLEEEALTEAVLKALKVIGIAALKQHDEAFLREIGAKIIASKTISKESVAVGLTTILGSWLHQVVKYNNLSAFKEIAYLVDVLFATESLQGTHLIILLDEWKNLAGNAALNPDMSLASEISAQMLKLGMGLENVRLWSRAVEGVAEVTKLALSRGNLEQAFPIMLTLLESGRKLLHGLKHGCSYDEFSPKAVQVVINECVMLSEYIARTNMVSSCADVILELFQLWTQLPQASQQVKSVRKFCQVLLMSWQSNKKKQARRTLSAVKCLAEPTLITGADREMLGL